MTNEDLGPEIRRRLEGEAARMLALATRCNAATSRDAGRGSLAEADSRSAPKPAERPLGRHPLLLGSTALVVAADHLRTWVAAVRAAPLPIYAGYTLLRAAIETAALCRWLVDPAESSEERVARGVAALLEDYRQRRSFETSFGAPEKERTSGMSAAGRYAELVADRDAAGIRCIPWRKATEKVMTYAPAEHDDLRPGSTPDWPYRLASGSAHGYSWTGLFSELSDMAPVGDAIHKGRISVNPGVLWLIAANAVAAVELAVEDLETYMRRGDH